MKKLFGLAAVNAGPPANDGGMGTALVELLGATVKGSASLVYTPPTYDDKEIEESDNIFDSLPSGSGKWELKLDSYNVSATSLHTVFGGTLTGVDPNKVWGMPDSFVPVEQSIQAVTKSGQVISLPRVKIIPAPNFGLTKGDLGKLSITGTPLQPAKAGVPLLSFADAVVAP